MYKKAEVWVWDLPYDYVKIINKPESRLHVSNSDLNLLPAVKDACKDDLARPNLFGSV